MAQNWQPTQPCEQTVIIAAAREAKARLIRASEPSCVCARGTKEGNWRIFEHEVYLIKSVLLIYHFVLSFIKRGMRVYTTVTRYFLILNRFNIRTYVGIWPHCVVRGLWHVLDPSQTSHCHGTRGFRGSWHDVDKSPFATKASPREANLGSRSKRHVRLTLYDHFSTFTNMPWLNMAHYTTLFFKQLTWTMPSKW